MAARLPRWDSSLAGIAKPYIVNTGLHKREVYACCPCGWIGDMHPANKLADAEYDAELHYTEAHTDRKPEHDN